MAASPGTQSTTPARVATAATFVPLLAASSSRRMVHIFNESAAILYVKFGNTASLTDYTLQIAAGGYYESPSGNPYSGLITGILASGSGFAQVTAY